MLAIWSLLADIGSGALRRLSICQNFLPASNVARSLKGSARVKLLEGSIPDKCFQSMRTHFKTDTTSFARSVLLLTMVAIVLNIDLQESDEVSYYDHRILYRIELASSEELPLQSSVLCISEDIPVKDVAKRPVLPSQFYATFSGSVLFAIQHTNPLYARPAFYSLHFHGSLSNIPHQNSDEDEASFLLAEVA